MKKIEKAPRHLSRESQELWRDLLKKWDFFPCDLKVLQTGLESYDLVAKCRVQIEKDGLTIQGKAHPLLPVLKEARQGFLRAMKQLNFQVEEPKGRGRPTDSERRNAGNEDED